MTDKELAVIRILNGGEPDIKTYDLDMELKMEEARSRLENKRNTDEQILKYNWEKATGHNEALYPEIGFEVYSARNKCGLTQFNLELKSGIAQSLIAKIETGRRNVTIRTLKQLAIGMHKILVISFQDEI